MRYLLLLPLLVVALRADEAKKPEYPPLPVAVSSFGAAVADGHVYVYGGHSGKTHSYSTETVVGTFRRFDLTNPAKGWEDLPGGPILQGLALVAHGGKVYRIGGMEPRNKSDAPTDNISHAGCAVYDPKAKKWDALPDMPKGRSSHDAVVVGDKIVVAGGWCLNGAGNGRQWHETALILDLAKKPLVWESVPQPFQRRALNLAVQGGKVVVVGGMGVDSEPERRVDVFDPAARKWAKLPEYPGGRQNGFSPAAVGVGGKLYVLPADGKLLRLNEKATAWDEVGTVAKGRQVHRLVAAGERLLVLGGASRDGNVKEIEVLTPGK